MGISIFRLSRSERDFSADYADFTDFLYHFNILGRLLLQGGFPLPGTTRYGGGTAPPPTQPPMIEMIRFFLCNLRIGFALSR